MTQVERRKLAKALREILDGNFHQGVSTIAEMAGLVYPAGEALKNARRISVEEVAARGNTREGGK